MAYTKINWQDSPSTATPLTAANLNHMDDGIYNISSTLDIKTGVWVPTLCGSATAGSFNYITRKGEYYRLGNLVYITAEIKIDSVTVRPLGEATVTGLPFTSAGNVSCSPYADGGANSSMRRIVVMTIFGYSKKLVLRGLANNYLFTSYFSSKDTPPECDIALPVGSTSVYMCFGCTYNIKEEGK